MRNVRFLSLALACICVLGLAVPAFAQEVECDAVYCFTAGDFSGEEETLTGICITGLPQSNTGTVMLGSRVLRAGDILTAGQLEQMTFHPLEDLLYGVVLLITISVSLNKTMLLGTSKTEVKIISEKSDAIRQTILSQVDRGCTMLQGRGGYLGKQTEVIMSIMSNHELPKIERLAREIDPNCFMIISRVTEVWGRGFTYSKRQEILEED